MTSRVAWTRRVSKLIPRGIKRELRDSLGMPSQEATLLRMRRLGFAPQTIVDVGAHVGNWTRMASRLFPDAGILMVEPQAACQPALEELASENSRFALAAVLLGADARDRVEFFAGDTIGSVLREHGKHCAPAARYKMVTLDQLTADAPFAQPDLIKIDVQGYERSVVQGGHRSISAAEAVLIELNLIEIYQEAAPMREMVDLLGDLGLTLFDICELIRRPRDNSLWQVDAMFVRTSSPLLASKSWC